MFSRLGFVQLFCQIPAGKRVYSSRQLLEFELLFDLERQFLGPRHESLHLEPPALKVKMRHLIQEIIPKLRHELGTRVDLRLIVIPNEVSEIPAKAGVKIRALFLGTNDESIRVIGPPAVEINIFVGV